MRVDELLVVRVLWATSPLLVGPAVAHALREAGPGVQALSTVGLWTGWALVLFAALVPRVPTLTMLRCGVAAGVATSAAATVAGEATGVQVAALALTAATLVAALSPTVGDLFVDGSSYGPERRFTLRVPLVLAALAVPLAWAVATAGVAAGPLLVADQQWVAGATATAVGWPLAVVSTRALHGLARRWIVFVPAGFVVHDPMTLREPVLVGRSTLLALGPAPAGTSARDLTQGASGLALEARLAEPTPMTLLRPGRAAEGELAVDRFLFTPSRPGSLLDEAAGRRLPVGR